MTATYRVEGSGVETGQGEWRGITHIYRESEIVLIYQNAVTYKGQGAAQQHAISLGGAILRALPDDEFFHLAHFSSLSNRHF